jgi:glycerophosphoryl diester phosphodiesterase
LCCYHQIKRFAEPYSEILLELSYPQEELKMLWISHRGESCDALENTMSAFGKARNTDGVDIHCNEKLEKDFFQHLREADMMVFTWTIDDIATGISFKNFGVDGITSNCAKSLMEQFYKR